MAKEGSMEEFDSLDKRWDGIWKEYGLPNT